MILGHNTQIDFFIKRFFSSTFHHAWILKGPKGVGKYASALEFSKEILKSSSFSDSFITAGTHPDLKVIRRADNKPISVEYVRNSLDFLSQTTIEGGWKILIIDSIGDLNMHSQNALLKALEEPKPKTLFLMILHDGEKILSTIRSRAIPLIFNALKKEDLTQYLKSNQPSLSSSPLYAELASGSIGRLNTLIQNEGLTLYQTMIKYLISDRKSALAELTLKYDPLFLGEMMTLIYQRGILFQTSQPTELIYATEDKDLIQILSALDWRKIGNFFTRLRDVNLLHLEPSSLFME